MSAPLDIRGRLPKRTGADPYQRRSLSQIEYIVFHHTHDGEGRPTAMDIAAYHVGPTAHLPFPSIAYALYIEADGAVELTNNLDAVTWHAGQKGDPVIGGVSIKNWRGLAICVSGAEPTPAQVTGAASAARWVDAQLGRKVPRVGHRDLSATECPGRTWEQWRSLIY
jgi:hypothetical protein